MEVLQSIVGYASYLKAHSLNEHGQTEALGFLHEYCMYGEPTMPISAIDVSFFDEFLIYWLPKNQSRLKEEKVEQVLKGVANYCMYIQQLYHTPKLGQYEPIKDYKQECLRIYRLKRLFSKHLGDPIINLEPFIIDFATYKLYKQKKDDIKSKGVYERGLFEVIDMDYDQTVILRKLSQKSYVRIMLEDFLAPYIRKGDILHLVLKRRQLYSCWEVQKLKGCYLSKAQEYLVD